MTETSERHGCTVPPDKVRITATWQLPVVGDVEPGGPESIELIYNGAVADADADTVSQFIASLVTALSSVADNVDVQVETSEEVAA